MKILLIFPPLWDFNLGPMLSLPLLSGMLKEQGHEVEILDANSLFMNFILSKDFIAYCNRRRNSLLTDKENLQKAPPTQETIALDLIIQQELFFLQRIYNCGIFEYIDKYDDGNTIVTDLFNNNKSFDFDRKIAALKDDIYMIFNAQIEKKLPYIMRIFSIWEQDILVQRIKNYNPDLIGFSLYYTSQYNWSLEFVKELKKQVNSTVVFGGTEMTQNRKDITANVFDCGVDAVIYGEGEEAFTALAQKKKLNTIPNIIYKDKNGNIQTNPVIEQQKFKFYKPNYSGINFHEYFTPEPVLQIESSRGCYWHKCEFCTFMDCSTYKVKKVDDLIEEIKEYVNKYNIHHFFFTDAAIHPEYAREFSKKLIENKLKIYYLTFLRLEKEFDDELLKLMYKAGLRIAMWGLESASDRILALYKKGTTAKSNEKILKTAHKIGIHNYCWMIVNFPREEIIDIDLNKRFLIKNHKYIDYISFHSFTLMPTSPIANKRKEFGLEQYEFKKIEMYNPPMTLRLYLESAMQIIYSLYKDKFSKYPTDLSYILLKLSKERP